MKRLLLLLLLSILAFQFGCVSVNRNIKKVTGIKTIAIVSFALDDWGANLFAKTRGRSREGGWGTGKDVKANAIQKVTNDLLVYTEKQLSQKWQVKKVSSFIKSKAYQSLTVDMTLNAYVPVVKKKALGLFTQNSTTLKRTQLNPALAKKLCETLNVDAVMVLFTEWTVQTGKMIPISKPYVKNLVSIWGKTGQQLFGGRVDKMGTMKIGGMGVTKSIDKPEVLANYKETYKQSLNKLLNNK